METKTKTKSLKSLHSRHTQTKTKTHKQNTKKYDLAIIGGGIAGLHTGLESLKRHPDWKILIIERYDLGGRIWSPAVGHGIHLEAGAGRIPTSHTRIMKIIQDPSYKLTTFPITTDKSYRIADTLLQDTDSDKEPEYSITSPKNNSLTPKAILKKLKDTILPKLSLKTLRNHTLYELIETHLGTLSAEHFRYFFEYDSEIFIANAECGLSLIDCTMLNDSFIGVAGGLQQIPKKMAREIRSRGGTILDKTEVLKLKLKHSSSSMTLILKKESKQQKQVSAQRVVIATSIKPMKDLLADSSTKILHTLEHILPGPLLRIYAKFPKCWFKGIGKVVSSNIIRYFIPINEKECIAMISYTDGAVAKAWNELHKAMGRNAFIETLLENLRRIFPEKAKEITKPIWVKEYYWKAGCHYWGKGIAHGGYTTETEKRELFNPLPGIFLCGEAISKTQAWIEGALETSEYILDLPSFN
jgi:monoamine oxidase